MNALQLCHSFTHRNFPADILQAKCDFREKTLFCVFKPPVGGLRPTYDVHLGLIGKCIVNYLLAILELFLQGITAEPLQVKRD